MPRVGERRLDAAALEKRAIRTFGDLEAMNRRMRALRKAFNLQAEDSGLVAVERTGQMPFWDEVFGLIERGLSPRNYAAAVERLLDTRQPGLHPGVLALLLDASA